MYIVAHMQGRVHVHVAREYNYIHVCCCWIYRSGSTVVESEFGLPMPVTTGFIEGLFYASFDNGATQFTMAPDSDVTVQAFDGS